MLCISKRLVPAAFLFLISFSVHAAVVTGNIRDSKGTLLPFASVTVKETAKGAIANSRGVYALTLEAGQYTLVCHHVGYQTVEKIIRVGGEDLQVDFELAVQELSMPEVVIRRGDDPAIAIMRQTIKKRNEYNRQVDSFTVEVYIKGLVRSRAVPDRVLGQKIDKTEMQKQGMDSAGKGILFLSESLTKVAYKHPGKIRMEVVSSRQSGGGFGFSVPFFVNFYTNNVDLFDGGISQRGFVSPLADAAFHYYRFRYEGNFFEDGRMIDRIRVTPRRKNEPLFEGFLQIVDGEWRIHSLSLSATQQNGLDLLDTVRIMQVHAPVTTGLWRTQNQVVSFAANLFGFAMAGDFLNVYSNYNLNPVFGKTFSNRILLKYDSTYNKRDSNEWARIRPVPLEMEEKRDFHLKDSLQVAEQDDVYRESNFDSLRKAQKPFRPWQFVTDGYSRNVYRTTAWKTYRIEPLLTGLQYNTVEGVLLSVQQSLTIRPKKGRNAVAIGWNTRYGFGNAHLNSFGSFTLRSKEETGLNRSLVLSGGKRLLQFNREEPVDELTNSLSTLFYHRNYLKVYEAWFGKAAYTTAFENGLRLALAANYESRIPVENTTDFSFFYKERVFTPNHPYELANTPFVRHSAMVASVALTYQPGQYYMALPNRKVPITSRYPTFELEYVKGFPTIFNSTADFDRWAFSVFDDANLKLWGTFKYRLSVGGFLNKRQVDLPDFVHFNGNQTIVNFKYLNSFQLAPYYRYSNTERVYTLLHAEHHFNGFLTNKIPVFNKLKWNLVAGTNTFYANRELYYVELFAGLENIFKIFRVDLVAATQAEPGNRFGVRIGLGGVIGNGIKRKR